MQQGCTKYARKLPKEELRQEVRAWRNVGGESNYAAAKDATQTELNNVTFALMGQSVNDSSEKDPQIS
jgi:hypothetical protein